MRLLRASVVALSALVGLLLVSGAAGASERQHDDVIDITFPAEEEVAHTPTSDGTGFIEDYGFPRSNSCGIHRAIDIMGPHGTKVYAALDGEVTLARTGSHNWLRIENDDGYRHTYLHLGRSDGPRDEAFAPGIAEGVEVERGEHIGYIGSSGNASESGPHVHFELNHRDLYDTPCRDGGWGYYNPFESLKDAIDRGDVSGSNPDSDDEGDGSDGDADDAESMPEHVERVRGATRIHTAAEIAVTAFPDGTDHVVVAPAYSFPEAIAAGPLAAALDAPVITTGPDDLHPRAAEVLHDLAPESVTMVGDHEVLGRAVADAIVTEAHVHADELTRLHGDGPAGTAAAVAEEVIDLTGVAEALVARGAAPDRPGAWPDALTGGWYGAKTSRPVLLATTDSLPEVTAEALAGLDVATIIGGSAAISEDVAAMVDEHVGDVQRRSGDSRFATAAALVDSLLDADDIGSDEIWVATGDDYADALAAGPSVAAHDAALVLIDGQEGEARDGLSDWFAAHNGHFTSGRAIGGTDAISDDALRTLADRLE